MIAFRFLQLIIASTFLLALVKGQNNQRPSLNDFEVELCDLPCQNNGRCIAVDLDQDGVLDPQCFCNTTFQGDLCESPRTCSLACENGGTCGLGRDAWWLLEEDAPLELFKEILYRCTLSQDDCKGNFLGGDEFCLCPSGTQGQLCENKCDKACLNDSECSFFGSEQRCRCKNGFYGDQCENQCTKSCQNGGFCLPSANGSGGFDEQCLCPAGFEGDQCETAIPCPNTCENGGVCKFFDNRWFQQEEESFEYLQDLIERCTIRGLPLSECLGGFGFEGETEGYCECPPGVFGRNCELICDLDCQNGSTCEFLGGRNNKACRCEPGFAGDLCQFQCTKNCENGGVCTSDGTSESCLCSPFYEGELCESERPCDRTCQNGGNCVMLEGYREFNEKYLQECVLNNFENCPGIDDIQRCSCTSSFVGQDCSTPCPCQNGGTCGTRYYFGNRKLEEEEVDWEYNDNYDYDEQQQQNEDGYFCQCPFSYYGRDCEFQYDSENCALDCQNGGYCRADFGWQGEDDAYWENDEGPDEQDGFYNNNNYNNNQNNNYNNPNGRQSNNGNSDQDEPYNTNGGMADNGFFPTNPPVSGRPFEYCVCPEGFTGMSCEIEIDACNNRCKNGGVCSTDSVSAQGGNRTLQDYGENGEALPPAAEDPAMWQFPNPVDEFPGLCSCPDGYSGHSCERKACGSGYCSNGGTCIELPSGQTTTAGDDYVCDCSTTTLEDVVGLGRNCDAIVYDECPWVNTKLNPNEPWSCAGYGRCYNEVSSRPNGSTSPTPMCSCGLREVFGPRCEFNRTNPKDVAWSECSLQCSNGGLCLKGATKPVADIFIPFIEGTKKSGLFDYKTPDFEYCYCPDGFFGVECDMQYELCGRGDHICFHGSKCTNSGGEWGCDCAGTESAGLYCQYKATDDCGDSDLETFCTNDSICSNGVCACSEGWEGTKCETEIKLSAPAGGDNNWSSAGVVRTGIPILFVSILSLVLVSA